MSQPDKIWDKLIDNNFKVSTDTRKDVANSIFFALKGDNFDGNTFVETALEKGAAGVVTENPKFKQKPHIYVVDDVLDTLQKLAKRYRETFDIPIIAIGGSNGKTTTRGLVNQVLQTRYKVYSTEGNLNNHIGVPLSILSMDKSSEIGVFEIGANHLGEHTKLLEILNPTHVLVTNNGMDHLEGFGSPEGAREANEEIITWADKHKAIVIKNKNHELEINSPLPLAISWEGKRYQTNLAGNYNLENINWALSVGAQFQIIDKEETLEAIERYKSLSQRSQLVIKDNNKFIVDCYNANPTSMMLALKSFVDSVSHPRGIILGDMLELGEYAGKEHKRVVKFIAEQKFDVIVLIGKLFKKAVEKTGLKHVWFEDSATAKIWFRTQAFDNYTFLLKGSRGIKVEQVIET